MVSIIFDIYVNIAIITKKQKMDLDLLYRVIQPLLLGGTPVAKEPAADTPAIKAPKVATEPTVIAEGLGKKPPTQAKTAKRAAEKEKNLSS